MRYGQQEALHDVSLHIAEGEVLGLLGPNGAGKTTLMKILVGRLQPTSGSVKYNFSEPLRTLHNSAERISEPSAQGAVSWLPEQNPLYEDMYVREYLLFMARLSRVPKARIEEVITQTGLTPEAHKRIGQLSKGFRQRIGLAQALLPDPQLLILDEPTTGLDPNQLEEIRALIRSLGRNRAVILSTHILQEVRQMCSRVIILDHGQIRAELTDLTNLEEDFKKATT